MSRESEWEEEVMSYLPLVKKVVSRLTIKRSDYDHDDLVNIGVIGLMDALEKFDESKKVPFEGYAYIRIRGSIIDEIRKTSKVSRSKMTRLNDYYKVKEEIEKTKMQTPSEKEICQKMGIQDKELSKIHETVHQLASISLEQVLFSENGGEVELIDTLEDTSYEQTDAALLATEKKELLTEGIKLLDKREQIILNLYYVEELSLKEISSIYNLSVPRISQIHGKILLKLKQHFKENYDD